MQEVRVENRDTVGALTGEWDGAANRVDPG